MKITENKSFDEERAFYGEKDILLRNVRFEGERDGESALKECENVEAEDCYFDLRYPFWHDKNVIISNSEMTSLCRAALWYSEKVKISGSRLFGIKALRECKDIDISDSIVRSPEFGWRCSDIRARASEFESEYFMLMSGKLKFDGIKMSGKYSFQYVEGAELTGCTLDTKDAFWHSKNVTVRDSLVKGEYLGWYSEGLTLINCTVTGTQPFCYCRGLRLVNCKMTDTDLCFEKSEVYADVTTPVISVKNPLKGRITAPSIGEIITDLPECSAQIIETDK